MQNVTYYTDINFKEKIAFYVIKAAIAVIAENPETAFHRERAEFAITALRGGYSLENYARGVMTNATIKTHIDAGTNYDDDLEFVVNSLFTAYAGGTTINS